MSLTFKAHCNKCIIPLNRGHGRVCSCSCFLCEECAKLLEGGGNCPSCNKPGVGVLDLSSDIVPNEVTTSLSDATARLEIFIRSCNSKLGTTRSSCWSPHNNFGAEV